jgi:hypothetical protein
MTKLDTLLADAPASIKRLTRDARGYPVPWFVDRKAPLRDGNPDFRIMDGERLKLAVRERRCWVCGGRITTPAATFVAGPMCGINRTSAEPPTHRDCARFSATACPFLAQPKRVRDERELPGDHMAGFGILRNPGVVMLWTCERWKTYRPTTGGAGLLFELGDPSTNLEWLREGRPATRAEIMQSIETGLPHLLAQAARDGAFACFELGRMTAEFIAACVPPEGGDEPA